MRGGRNGGPETRRSDQDRGIRQTDRAGLSREHDGTACACDVGIAVGQSVDNRSRGHQLNTTGTGADRAEFQIAGEFRHEHVATSDRRQQAGIGLNGRIWCPDRSRGDQPDALDAGFKLPTVADDLRSGVRSNVSSGVAERGCAQRIVDHASERHIERAAVLVDDRDLGASRIERDPRRRHKIRQHGCAVLRDDVRAQLRRRQGRGPLHVDVVDHQVLGRVIDDVDRLKAGQERDARSAGDRRVGDAGEKVVERCRDEQQYVPGRRLAAVANVIDDDL